MNEEKEDCAIYEGWKGVSEMKSPNKKKKGRRSAQIYRWTGKRSRAFEMIRHEKEER